jgi:CubicO group peptidase (beta-lactamase class C family)
LRLVHLVAALALGACAVQGAQTDAAAPAQRCESAPAVAADPRLRQALDAAVDAAVEQGFAGQVAVMRDGAYLYRRSAGFADLASTTPVTNATLFHVASITKYFTAALALKAAEQNLLSLDTPIARLAPETAFAARADTVADLLAHRSGMGASYVAEAHDDPDQALAALAAAPVDPARAGAFRYSNDGYDLLGILIERAYGARYETIARRELLAPACIDGVAFWGEGRLEDARHRSQPLTAHPPALLRRNYGMLGSAGLLITASDLVAWQHALRTGRVLAPQSLAELFAPRGETRLGRATFGGFLIAHPRLGRVFSARGAEDWGDNAVLNEYLDCGLTLAIVTSRGPAENSGRPLFRDLLSEAAESAFISTCAPAAP